MKFNETIDARLTGRHKKAFLVANPVKGKKILDIGCAFGWFEKIALENNAKEVIGIEPEAKTLLAAKKDVPKAQFLTASVFKLPFVNDSFDAVVMIDVLEHLPKKSEEKALLEIKRVLKKGGTLTISVPHNHFLVTPFDPAYYFGHRHYTRNKLTKIFQNAGFKNLQFDFGGGSWEVISLLDFYFCKHLLKRDLIFKDFFVKMTDAEYLEKKNAFATIYLKAQK